jgi:hypothetical protein
MVYTKTEPFLPPDFGPANIGGSQFLPQPGRPLLCGQNRATEHHDPPVTFPKAPECAAGDFPNLDALRSARGHRIDWAGSGGGVKKEEGVSQKRVRKRVRSLL